MSDSKNDKMNSGKDRGGSTGGAGGPPAGPPAPPPTLPPLFVLSWNVFLLPEGIQLTGHDTRAELMGMYLAKIQSAFHIICIQKAFHDKRREVVLKAFKSYFPHIVSPLKVGEQHNSGITVLSKIPIKVLKQHDWAAAAGLEASEPKGYVLLELTHQGQPVQLVVCHMQGHTSNETKEKEVRAKQFLELKEGLNAFRRPNVTQIICGDFAIKAGTSEYDTLRSELSLDHPWANTNLWSTREDMRTDFPNIRGKIDGTELSDYFFLRNSTPVEMTSIKRGVLDTAWGNWLTGSSKAEPLSYKAPMTGEIHLQPAAQRPLGTMDYSTGQIQTTYLSFIQEKPERTYKAFYSDPANVTGMEYGLSELKSIVREARSGGKIARAMGSGHSFSHVARAAHSYKGAFAVDVGGGVEDVEQQVRTGINALRVLANNDPRLKVGWAGSNLPGGHRLVELGAGTMIQTLNEELEKWGLGLINMGTYNGQTFAGASSTSTHGSGITLPPFPDMVRSLVLVSTDAAHNVRSYRIEPSQGMTDPSKFKATEVDELIQNDDVFYSAICAMGSFGLIHSFVIEVRPFYLLDEKTDVTTWATIKAAGIAGLKKELAENRHFELVVAPHKDENTGVGLQDFKNQHATFRIRRNLSTSTEPRGMKRGCYLTFVDLLNHAFSEEHRAYPRCYRSDYRTDLPPSPVGVNGNEFPGNFTNMVSSIGYTHKYYLVFRQGGHTIGGYAIELTAPVDKAIEVMDRLLLVTQANRDQGRGHSGPIGVRFVAASKAYMSQFYGRDSVTFEVTMLRGTPNGYDALKAVQDAFLGDPDIRMHWGLTMAGQDGNSIHVSTFRTEDHWRARFPKFDVWLQNYRRFNTSGVFSSKFTEWMGIDVPRDHTGKPIVAINLVTIVHCTGLGDLQIRGNSFAGTRGQYRVLEGLQLHIDPAIPGLSVRYQGHLEDIGDTNTWLNEGQFLGSRWSGKRLEGFIIELTGPAAAQYKIKYMAHLEGVGDTPWVNGGQFCGTKGQGKRVEGVQIHLERA